MIIDVILDRKHEEEERSQSIYNFRNIRDNIKAYEHDYINKAFETDDNKIIQEALCKYIQNNDYPEEIKDYINSRNWNSEVPYQKGIRIEGRWIRTIPTENNIEFDSIVCGKLDSENNPYFINDHRQRISIPEMKLKSHVNNLYFYETEEQMEKFLSKLKTKGKISCQTTVWSDEEIIPKNEIAYVKLLDYVKEQHEIINKNQINDEDLELCRLVIPGSQFSCMLDLSKGEEGKYFNDKFKEIADIVRERTSDVPIDDHKLALHYFIGNSDFYVSELYKGENGKPDGYGYGYCILNGDLQMSEWGDVSLDELKSFQLMNVDLEIDRTKSIEALLHDKYPDYFDSPELKVEDSHSSNRNKKDINKIESNFIDEKISEEQLFNSIHEKDKIIKSYKEKNNELSPVLNNFKNHGIYNIIGTKLDIKNGIITEKGWNDLNTACQIYRNKNFETFRFIIFDEENKKIANQTTVTSYMPDSCIIGNEKINPASDLKNYLINENKNGKKLSLIICHNHPSGDTEPSKSDIHLTEEFKKAFVDEKGNSLLKGHIILDHSSFSLWNNDGYDSKWKLVGTEDNNIIKITDKELYLSNYKDIVIENPWDLVNTADKINDEDNWNDDFIPVIITDSNQKITAIENVDIKEIKDLKDKNIFNECQRANAGSYIFPVITAHCIEKQNKESIHKIEDNLCECIKNNYITDAVIEYNDHKKILTENYLLKPGQISKAYSSDIEVESTFEIDIKKAAKEAENILSAAVEDSIKKIELSQDDKDWYRNTFQARKEIEKGIINIIYRHDKKDNEPCAILPDHLHTENDYFEKINLSGKATAINPDKIAAETEKCSNEEKKNMEKAFRKNSGIPKSIKLNEYEELKDVPYFKDKRIKTLENENTVIKNHTRDYLQKVEDALSKNPVNAKKLLEMKITYGLTDEQWKDIMKDALKKADEQRHINVKQNQHINTNHNSRRR